MLLPLKVFALCFIVAVIVYVLVHQAEKRRYRNYDMREIDCMTGVEFEKLLNRLFGQMGYAVQATPKSNDYGADLILKKRGRTIAVQAKRYRNKVGISAVQQVMAAKVYYDTDDCIVITNNYYTAQATRLALTGKVRLIDRDGLQNILSSCTAQKKKAY